MAEADTAQGRATPTLSATSSAAGDFSTGRNRGWRDYRFWRQKTVACLWKMRVIPGLRAFPNFGIWGGRHGAGGLNTYDFRIFIDDRRVFPPGL
jgi:hypothetical protein